MHRGSRMRRFRCSGFNSNRLDSVVHIRRSAPTVPRLPVLAYTTSRGRGVSLPLSLLSLFSRSSPIVFHPTHNTSLSHYSLLAPIFPLLQAFHPSTGCTYYFTYSLLLVHSSLSLSLSLSLFEFPTPLHCSTARSK